MSATAAVRMPGLSTLLRLGRISNLPTVWTNVLAGSVIAGGDRHPDRITLIMMAMTAFYVGGMYLNDFFDREIDARDRPGRPIHAGEIRAGTVSSIGFGLLATGIALMIPFGLAATIWGALLAGAIVLYDVWHKGNVLSPLVMGACRALVYIGTGAALAGNISTAMMIGAVRWRATWQASPMPRNRKTSTELEISGRWRCWLSRCLSPCPLCSADGSSSPLSCCCWRQTRFAIRLLAKRPVPGSVPLAVSGLIAAICLVDALAIALNGGGVLLVAICAFGYPLTRLFQKSIPGT